MMNWRTLMCFIAMLILGRPGFAQQSQNSSQSSAQVKPDGSSAAAIPLKPLPPGIHTRALQSKTGPTIRYTLSIPDNYHEKASCPVVVALHYGGVVKPFYGKGLIENLVEPGLAELNAIIVAPDSVDGGEWNSKANEQVVMLLVRSILKSYSTDPRKVVVTGFSMGGEGTWHFASKFHDQFSAAIPIAGGPLEQLGQWKMPVFAVHSEDDMVLPLAPTKKRVQELKALGLNAELVILKGVSHFESDRYVEGLQKSVPWLKQLWK